ncbi:MAG: transposase [Bacteroides sp.]|nr:transposase [Bacteroides sp.]MCM1413619.1 transposase [Bacteroides sp.]MCM1471164.1 transposase [Bacteroides sp.]
MKHELTSEKIELIKMLLNEGLSYREISAKTGIPKTIIHRWMTIFAEYEVTPTAVTKMPAKRIVGQRAPEYSEESVVSESTEQKIARLEKELETEKLRSELYKEIISVAEKKYNISITKKAGAKQ